MFWNDFVKRVLPNVQQDISYIEDIELGINRYRLTMQGDGLSIKADCFITAAHALYLYLKKYCNVNLSWNGNRKIDIDTIKTFKGVMVGEITQKYRVYMNYCTLNYSMSFWDYDRWAQELDFMALNGINMPLMVLGTEAVWYETLLEYGYDEEESLACISGPCFWAWQLMTNITGYMSPPDKSYVYDRLELGKKVLHRALEMGMYPIQQGFSGFVPLSMKEKYPNNNILAKSEWCLFPKTAQIDPLDPLFMQMGKSYMKKQKELLGTYHYYAADPFHEGSPPKNNYFYLRKVGKVIDQLYQEFDSKSIWVMQSWSIRSSIAKAVPKGRLLILDLNSLKYKRNRYYWGHEFVLGYLHNFGGKNAMQGRAAVYANNKFTEAVQKGKKAVGTGLFMEGIEQNPFIYDLLFEMTTRDGDMDLDAFVREYISRRYGKYDSALYDAYKVLLETCYHDGGQNDNEVGSLLCSTPYYSPFKSSPCDNLKKFYSQERFEDALAGFYSVADKFACSDGFQFDIMDIARQAMSNLFNRNHYLYARYAQDLDATTTERLYKEQLQLLDDMDELLACRSENCLDRWLYDAQSLGKTEQMKKYYDYNARALVTLWGEIGGEYGLHDYAWKEWSGMVGGYYKMRWEYFYTHSQQAIEHGKLLPTPAKMDCFGRPRVRGDEFYTKLNDMELAWCDDYKPVNKPVDKDVLPVLNKIIAKYFHNIVKK